MAASSVDVFLRLVGQRKFSAEVTAAGAQLEAMGLKGAKALAGFARQSERLKTVGSTLRRNVTLPLAAVAAYGVKTAVDFDKSMAQVQIAANLTGRQMQQMRALALKEGARTIFSANESAEAMLDLSKAGIGPTAIQAGALASTMNLAATEGIELAKTAEIIGAAMNTFGIKASKSQAIADALAGGSIASTASVEGLAESLAQGGQSAAMYGVNINEAVGTLAAFAQNGMQASDAGTSFKTFLMRLNPVTKKQRELMNELNLSFFDQKGHFVGLIGVAERLRDTLRGKTQEERGQILQTLFGSDAQRAANVVYREGASGLKRYVKATKERGAAEKMAAAQMKGLPGAIEQMSGSLETAALVFGEAIAPAVTTVAGEIESLADAYSELPKSTQELIAVGAGIAAMSGPALWFLGALAGGVGRGLIAVHGLAKIGKGIANFGRTFSAAMSEAGYVSRPTVSSSLQEAWAGSGAKGAMQTAKGFAQGLSPALAAYGIGNIITSATSGDWKDAGFEAGGALVGGIAGFMAGGPVGAMLGVGIGSLGGEIISGLFDSGPKLAPVQRKLARDAKTVAKYFREQQEAGANLARSSKRVKGAQEDVRTSSRRLRSAEHNLVAVKRRSGSSSVDVARAEWKVARAQRGHENAARRLRNAERLRGQELQWFKQISRTTVLEERNQINNLKRKRDSIIKLFRSEKDAGAGNARLNEIAKRGQHTVGELAKAQKRYKETLVEASAKAGPKYARFLERGTRWAISFGSAVKAANARIKTMTRLGTSLSENPFEVPSFENFLTPPIAGPPTPAPKPLGPPAPKRGNHPRGKSPRRQLFSSAPKRLTIDGERVLQVNVTNHNVTTLDGKVVAESTTRRVQRAANRQ